MIQQPGRTYTASPGMGGGEIQRKSGESCPASPAMPRWSGAESGSPQPMQSLLPNMPLAPALCLNEWMLEAAFLIASTLSRMLILPSNTGCPLPSLKYMSFSIITRFCLLLLPHTSYSVFDSNGQEQAQSLNTLAEVMETRALVLHLLKGLQPAKTNICEN